MKKLTNDEFVRRSKKAHGGFYGYAKARYVNQRNKVEIICPIHGEFWQFPYCHMQGHGCEVCARKLVGNKNTKIKADFISKANHVHDGFYDYSNVIYKHSKEKVEIICPIHGEFWQTPSNHITGQGCPKCGKVLSLLAVGYTQDIFINLVTKKHNGFYDYSKTVYENSDSEITIICPIHGEFSIKASRHSFGQGCFICTKKESKGEKRIRIHLEKSSVDYIQYKKFDNFRDVTNKRYEYDFYLPSYNLLVEYDGEFHHIETKWETLERTKKTDTIKTEYAKNNGIELLRIPYWDIDKIETILDIEISSKTSF